MPYAQQADLLFIDEAQLIPQIGQGLKIIVDQLPQKKIIATGSSSFELAGSYLFRDLLTFEGIKGSNFAHDLTKLLALQIGSEVSFNELAQKLAVNTKTVQRYLDLLEKSFIIKSVYPFKRNRREEIRNKSKYYFLDNGIRNAIISQFNSLDMRNDIGALWENFLVTERIKLQQYRPIYTSNHFWRTWEQQEVDWVEEREGKLLGYEFKWNNNKKSRSKDFLDTYKEASIQIVNPDNYLEFVTRM